LQPLALQHTCEAQELNPLHSAVHKEPPQLTCPPQALVPPQVTFVMFAPLLTPDLQAEEPQVAKHCLPPHFTAPPQLLKPEQSRSQDSVALHSTPDAQALVPLQLTSHVLPLHTTVPPHAEPSQVKLQVLAVHSMPEPQLPKAQLTEHCAPAHLMAPPQALEPVQLMLQPAAWEQSTPEPQAPVPQVTTHAMPLGHWTVLLQLPRPLQSNTHAPLSHLPPAWLQAASHTATPPPLPAVPPLAPALPPPTPALPPLAPACPPLLPATPPLAPAPDVPALPPLPAVPPPAAVPFPKSPPASAEPHAKSTRHVTDRSQLRSMRRSIADAVRAGMPSRRTWVRRSVDARARCSWR
jgi:hypothetical protein